MDPSELSHGYLKAAFDPKCSVCNDPGPRKEDMMNCSKCSYSGMYMAAVPMSTVLIVTVAGHHKCLEPGDRTLSLLNGEKKWLCTECRPKCINCNKPQSDVNDPLMTCVECDSCYHVHCLDFNVDIEGMS